MKQAFFSFLYRLLPSHVAYAHCDVPCGIYDPVPSQIAAATVLKMVEKIQTLPSDENSWSIEDRANFVRYILTKEEHAEICKKEILTLWTDYFKPEHLAKFPNLHDKFWKATKLCSENKQHVSKDSAEKLIKTVDEIAKMFQQTKSAK